MENKRLAGALVLLALAACASGAQGFVGAFVWSACKIDLLPGWNLFSMCSEPANKSVQSVLAGIDYRYVMQWNESAQEFGIYSPRAAQNPFAYLEMNRSYFVYLISPATLYLGGPFANDTNISLSQGWNAPAYPYEFTSNISVYFNESAFRYLMKWNASSQEFVLYSPRAAQNPFTKIFMGEGQFIYATDPAGTLLAYNRTALRSG
ncbi:MAG: hypothetical protein NTY90_02195 [Candidatus Micrarchaeota archaeon]|nr:hypothetical protein [Candidatus Micrarchaeota archaeon]